MQLPTCIDIKKRNISPLVRAQLHIISAQGVTEPQLITNMRGMSLICLGHLHTAKLAPVAKRVVT